MEANMPALTQSAAPAEVITALTSMLTSSLDNERATAARVLGNLQSPQAITALLERLQDEDIDVCIDSLAALGKIGSDEAVQTLTECLLNDPDKEVKLAAVQALANIASPEAMETLINYALQSNERVYTDDMGDWDHFWDIQLAATKAVGHNRTPQAVPILKKILEDDDGQDIETEVLNSLAQCGEEGVEIVIQRLQGKHGRQQRRAAKALALSQQPEATIALQEALSSEDADVRIAAINSLLKLAPETYLKTLMAMCHDQQPEVREAALGQLASMAKQGQGRLFALTDLIDLLVDGSAAVRALIVNLITDQVKHMQDPQATLSEQQLVTCQNLLYTRYTVEAIAACELAQVLKDPLAMPSLSKIVCNDEAPIALRRQAGLAVAEQLYYSQEILHDLSQCIHHDDQTVRLIALQTIMGLHQNQAQLKQPEPAAEPDEQHDDVVDPKDAGPILAPLEILTSVLLNDMDQAGAEVIETPMPEAPAQAAIRAQEENDTHIAVAAPDDEQRISLVSLDAEAETAPPLLPADYPSDYADDIPRQEKAFTSTLQAIAAENVETALALSQAGSDNEDASLSQLLEQLPDEDAAYRQLIENNIATADKLFVSKKKINVQDDVRQLCIRILAEADDEVLINLLIQHLNDANADVRLEAVTSLGKIAARSKHRRLLINAAGSLLTKLEFAGADMRLAIIRTLGLMHYKPATEAVMACLQDDSTDVRKEAMLALLSIRGNKLHKAVQKNGNPEDPDQQILQAFMQALQDKEYSVRKVAAETLADLRCTRAQDSLIAAGVADGGQLSTFMGQMLRRLDTDAAGKSLVVALQDTDKTEDNRTYRSHIASMLEAIYRPDNKFAQANI
ncbi:MAG: HEAT repeat domain-containing protein [Gammaproteobacteria bacterium]|jgi:HEAT repeat protein|nr:HEAT repeat domain-containing protein [Gammaproteobacteria bacterium]